MAGQYFYDPRPYYGVNNHSGLMPLDEVFYGRYEPVPYWMDQRMAPVSFEDGYFSNQKQMMYMPRRPEMQQYIQREDNLMAYKRPEVRDDVYTDMYRRPQQMMRPEVRDDMYMDMYRRPQQMMRPEVRDDMYMDYSKRPMHFNGAPTGGYGAYPEMRQLRGQSQDDTWLHTMTPMGAKSQSKFTGRGLESQGMMVRNGPDQLRLEEPMGYMPSRNIGGGEQCQQMGMPMGPVSNGRKSDGDQYMTRQMEMPVNQMTSSTINHGGDQYRQMPVSNKTSNGNSNQNNKQMNLPRNQSANGYNIVNNGYNGYEQWNGKSQGQGDKSMRSSGNQGNTKQRGFSQNNDSSDEEDDDDEYENGNHGTKRSSNNRHYHQGEKQQLLRNKFDSQNYGSEKTGLKSKFSGQGKSNSNQAYGNTHSGQNQSKTSQKLYQDTWDSSSDDDEGFTYTKKASKGQHMLSTTKVQHSGHGHGNKQQSSFQDHNHHAKQTQYGSNQSKCVELKVPICCDNCERKVRNALEYMDGVESVLCDQWSRKVIVYGNVKPETVLKKVRRVKKTAELWQQSKQQLQQVQLY
ncbi:uncharacterized protein [Physcomitrium patens]|uniref:HMA domain-containing protein n=1 Tax=Physcomitrium patens TaxID=3218 RepID=A9TRS3_PHYPA|nr:probable serine/threonine-protein kinase clkA [Physcomitrium patens]PNR33857.1 hypothetical protein PHYPA_023673 [Physcomitrium patens]|eukprot:XP_024403968.1 probable serine/threonine-protein kinase clkA [Physcomitrella patens]